MEGDNLKWMLLLRDYMIKNHINHTFWCLNTNSGDTGGLWDSLGFQQGAGTTIDWNEPKYEMFEESLWQTLSSGKYIGLDHEVALGANGISLGDFYANYANSEGSNLDGGKKGSGGGNTVTPKPPVTTEKPAITTTTTKPVTTTEKPTTPAVTTTVSSGGTATLIGDANMDGKVTIADSTAILQSLGNPDKYALSAEGAANADCCAPGSGVTTADALAIQKYDAKLISKLPVEE